MFAAASYFGAFSAAFNEAALQLPTCLCAIDWPHAVDLFQVWAGDFTHAVNLHEIPSLISNIISGGHGGGCGTTTSSGCKAALSAVYESYTSLLTAPPTCTVQSAATCANLCDACYEDSCGVTAAAGLLGTTQCFDSSGAPCSASCWSGGASSATCIGGAPQAGALNTAFAGGMAADMCLLSNTCPPVGVLSVCGVLALYLPCTFPVPSLYLPCTFK